MARRYYNLEKETKEYLKACEVKGIVNQTNIKTLNDYVINRKANNLNVFYLKDSPIVLNDLVLWLDASITDSYSTFNSLILKNLIPPFQNTTLTAGTTGDNIFGGRVHFEGQLGSTGVGKIAVLPTWPSLGLSTNFTISLWFSFTRYGNSFYDFTLSCESYLNNGFRAGMAAGTNKLGFFSGQSGGTLNIITNYAVILNTPINYTLTYNGTTGTSYINGAYDNQHTGTFKAPTGNIRYNVVGGGLKSDTKLSVFNIYNRALSPAEVLQNYNATKGRFGL